MQEIVEESVKKEEISETESEEPSEEVKIDVAEESQLMEISI